MPERGLSRREVLRIGAAVGVGAAFTGTLGADLLRRAGLRRVRRTEVRMGTIVTITVVHPESEGARAMVDRAFGEMTRLERRLSRHDTTAPLGRLAAPGIRRAHGVSEELARVLARGLALAEESGGAFDPTVLPVLRRWEDAGERGSTHPSDRELAEARACVGYGGVRCDGETLVLDDGRMGLTLDGIAKGFVVDRTMERLVADGADRVLVDAGGDMASGGAGSLDEPWRVSVQDPREPGAGLARVQLAGEAVATSGDYLHAFTEDRRNHHILDPRTGRSPARTSAVSVRAGTAMEADALSTTLLVLGAEEGLRLVERRPGAEALIVDKSGRVRSSRGFAGGSSAS